MKAMSELFAELLKISFAGAGLFYAAEVMVNFVRSGESYQPAVDHEHPVRSAGRLLVGAGVLVTAAVVALGRPVVAMLSEASAEVGEWALAKRQNRVPGRPGQPVGRAA
jgi:hypothetical protein